MWQNEPQPAHWRVRSQHVTRQESRTSRMIYLGIMFPFSVLLSAFYLGCLLILVFLFYMFILIFPLYGITAFFTLWSLHFIKKLTGIGPEWLKDDPSSFIEEKAKWFKNFVIFAFTWRGPAVDKPNETDDHFIDPEGPYGLYTYKALPIKNEEEQIRVLDILPGHKDSPIRCKIRHVSLKHDEPAYEAISYCWGGQEPSMPVYVYDTGEEGPRQVLVTRNLIQALQRFRQPGQERTVWADGICINQEQSAEAKDECSRQVKMMDLIYQKAQHCLIWLGQGPEEAPKYLDAIRELVQLEKELNSAEVTIDPIFLSPEEKVRRGIPHGDSSHLKGLQLILSHVWLTRVWIVQEASLAQQATIYVGSGSVAWDDFVTAQMFATRIGLLFSESEAPMNGMIAIRCNRAYQDDRLRIKGEDNILALFARFRNFDASNAKDKVYGLVSLLAEKHSSQWPVGLEAEEAYLYAAHRILSGTKSLDLLGIPRRIEPSGHPGGEKAETINVPTWVPDWRSSQVPLSLRMLEFAPCERKYNATKSSECDINLSPDGCLLGVDGYQISIIKKLGDIYRYRPVQIGLPTTKFIRTRVKNLIEVIDTYLNWKRTVLSSDKANYVHSATPMTAREAFWRTMIAYESADKRASVSRLTESFEAFDAMIISGHKSRLLIKAIPVISSLCSHWIGKIIFNPFTPAINMLFSLMIQDPEAQDFCNDLVIAWGRRIARTEDGHFALVPGNAAIGDEITLLKGAKAPIVLRKHREGDNWEHVGEAYVEGLMNGEKWDESLCKRRWLA